MVNAQEYIEKNFPKDAEEIKAQNKDLEGNLDLSGYSKLKFITFLNSDKLTGLKLGNSPNLSTVAITNTGITDFSFLFNAPNVNTLHLPKRDTNLRSDTREIAQLTRNLSKAHQNQLNERNQQIEELKEQLAQLTNQLKQKELVAQLTNQLKQKETENNHLHSQIKKIEELVGIERHCNI